MNKKYLNVALFGVLLAASTGTFTSCKDYDDDIDGLEQKITSLSGDLSSQSTALQTALTAAKSEAETAKKAAAEAKTEAEKASALALSASAEAKAAAIADAKKYVDELAAKTPTKEELAVAVGKIDGIQAGLNTLTDALKKQGIAVNEEIAAREKADKALQTQLDALKKFEEATGKNFDSVSKDLQAMREELAKLGSKAEIENLLKEANTKIQKEVSDKLNTLMGVLSSRLNSLVFRPDFYYHGIEAMEAITFNYNALLTKVVNADDDFSTDAPTAVANGATSLTPGLVANYHMNPSTADYKKITSLSYITDDKAYTKANVVVANIYDFTADKGVLTVKSHLTDGIVKDIENDGKVTVLALQAHYNADGKKDTIITSDYAAVKAVNYKDLLLADSEPAADPETRHLYKTAKDAIDNAATYEILWNNAGMDVANLVNTHRNLDKAHAKWDKNANDGTVKNYGFKYSFELVGYHKGNNKTSESAHAAMKGSVLRPQMTKDGKQQAFGADQNKASKDREPLVRVILTDTVSKKIAAVGYLKFKIVDKATPTKNEVVLAANFPFKDNYTVDCAETAIKHSLTWYQVEEQIIAQLEKQGISKADFHDNFTLDGGVANATQYNGVAVGSSSTTKVGVVEQTTWDPADEMTEVLTWTVKNNEAYQIFKNKTVITVNVRYSREVGTGSGIYQYVYVTFDWTPATRNVTPAGAIADANKISNYWYAQNNITAKTGYSDIHANVETVGQTDANDEFNSDMLNAFLQNKVTISNIDAAYTAFTDAKLTKSFTFVNPQGTKLAQVTGNSGKKYNITVADQGKTLQATAVGQPAVKDKVVILNGSILEYQKNEIACDILNYADHKELEYGKTFTAKIQINAANCGYVPFTLSNNTFFAKFLRPVTIGDPHETNFLDATTGGSKAKLQLTFIDWRDHNFEDSKVTKGHNYYKYYGIKEIKYLENQTKTDLNAAQGDFSKLLTDVTEKVKFTFTAPTTAQIQDNKFFGELLYENNNTTLGDFQIKAFFDVTYDWGTITVPVICKIAKTEAN